MTAEDFPAPAASRAWMVTLADLALLLVGFFVLLQANHEVPPREIVFLHRRLAGVFIMLSALRCELRTRETLLEALSLS